MSASSIVQQQFISRMTASSRPFMFEEEEEEDDSNIPLESNGSAMMPSDDSSLFMHSSSSDSVSKEMETRRMNEYVRELKEELHQRCQLDWLNKFEPWKHSPKVELNLLLHEAIRERTLKRLTRAKGIQFENNDQMVAQLFQNDYCLLQPIVHEIANDQREQRIIYTEILFRPEAFNIVTDVSHAHLKAVAETMVESIRSFTVASNKRMETKFTSKSTVLDPSTRSFSFNIISPEKILPYTRSPLPIHLKLILSCHWTGARLMPEYIRLARRYPDEIVGIDLYGSEDECRTHWQEFTPYRRLAHRWQASMADYEDQQLITEVIRGLALHRVSEAYALLLSRESIDRVFIKHGIPLIVCPTSAAYISMNQSETERGNLSSRRLDIPEFPSYSLIDYLQSESISYSLASLSPVSSEKNLSLIYKDLLDPTQHSFTCEHMQWWNENALKSSFASQRLKNDLISYVREHFIHCHEQTLLLRQFQETTQKWQKEISDMIDSNAQIARELAVKVRQEKRLQPADPRRREEMETRAFEDEEEEEETDLDQSQ